MTFGPSTIGFVIAVVVLILGILIALSVIAATPVIIGCLIAALAVARLL